MRAAHRDRFPCGAHGTMDIAVFRVDQQRNVPLPAPTRRIPVAVPPPHPGGDDLVRCRGRRCANHRHHERIRSLGRLTALNRAESSRRNNELSSCGGHDRGSPSAPPGHGESSEPAAPPMSRPREKPAATAAGRHDNASALRSPKRTNCIWPLGSGSSLPSAR